ncbi:MAG: hypothetical protein ABR508_12610 [Candidatus Baltobacteraceae bacterium]
MKAVLKFITGNSVVTPAGVVAAVLTAYFGRGEAWSMYAFYGVLLVTLIACTFERP